MVLHFSISFCCEFIIKNCLLSVKLTLYIFACNAIYRDCRKRVNTDRKNGFTTSSIMNMWNWIFVSINRKNGIQNYSKFCHHFVRELIVHTNYVNIRAYEMVWRSGQASKICAETTFNYSFVFLTPISRANFSEWLSFFIKTKTHILRLKQFEWSGVKNTYFENHIWSTPNTCPAKFVCIEGDSIVEDHNPSVFDANQIRLHKLFWIICGLLSFIIQYMVRLQNLLLKHSDHFHYYYLWLNSFI